jgi:hypothetical protein
MTASQGLPPYPTDAELKHAAWFKSNASNTSDGCVEVAHLDHWTVVRDSKNPYGPKLSFSPAAVRTLIAQAKDGAYDL